MATSLLNIESCSTCPIRNTCGGVPEDDGMLLSLALLGIGQRLIRTQRTPDGGPKRHRKAFPEEVTTLGDALRKARFERGLKLRLVASLLHVSSNRVSAWEHDEDEPSGEEWAKLTKLLDLPATPAEARPNSG
jgi:DNA-binding transcriptional regulator YiaG